MRIEHLYYLVDIAETKSITLSAEHLFISQQGLSQAIQKLETDLDVSLFLRSRQGVFLTDAGNVAAEKAREIILKYEELLQSIEPYSKTLASTEKLLISTTPFMGNFLPQIIDLFRQKHPSVNLHIEEKKPDEIVTQLIEGCIDLGLVNLPEYHSHEHLENNNILFEKICNCEYLACVAKSSPLGKKTMFTTSEIKNHPLVVYNLEPYLETLTHMFGDLSQVNIIVKTNTREIFMKTILHGKAIGIITRSDFNLFREKSMALIPIKDSLSLDFGWLASKKYPLPSIAETFLEIYKLHLVSEFIG